MSSQFSVMDVSAEFIMDIAKVISAAPYALSIQDIENSVNKTGNYVTRAITQGLQLSLIESQNNQYISSSKYSLVIKGANKDQHYLHFRESLQKYPPFLLFIDFISKGYNIITSAQMVKGIFRISASEKIIEKSFKSWGFYSKLIIEKEGKISIPDAEKGLPSVYVENLLKAMQAELKANIFLIETMGAQAFAYLTENKISIENLSNALINYEAEPKML